MRFVSLSLQGFKKYTNAEFSFRPGLNVFVGPNASGKTTLHQALVTALYGLGSQSQQLLPDKETVRSWDLPSDSEVALEFELGDEHFLLKRNLDEGKVQLHRKGKGDATFQLVTSDRAKVDTFLSEQTGIASAGVFNQTISIQQGQIHRLQHLEKVGESVEEVFTGKERFSIRQVQDKLYQQRKALKKQRNEKPGKIDELQVKLEDCEQRLQAAQQQDDQRQQLQAEVEKLGGDLPSSKARQQELKDLIARAQAKQDHQVKFSAYQKRYQEIDRRLQSWYQQQESLRDIQEEWKQVAHLKHYEDRFESLMLSVLSLEKVQKKLGEERAKLERERQEQLVLVHNDSWIFMPWAIWLAVGMGVLSLLGMLLLSHWWPGIFLFVSMVWGGLFIRNGIVDQFNVTDVRSERHQQLLEESREEQAEVGELSEGMSLSDELLLDPEKLRDFLQHYYRVKERWHQRQATMKVFEQSENFEGLEREKEDLSFNLNSVQKELMADEQFQPTAEEIAAWQKEIEQIEKQIPFQEQQWNVAQGRAEQMQQESVDVETILAEKKYLQQEIEELVKRQQAVELAQEVLEEVVQQYRWQSLPKLQQRAEAYVQHLSSGLLEKIVLTDNWPEVHAVTKGKKDARPEDLSAGIRDQLYFSLRLAAADLMSKDHALPLILDDPLVNYDDDRFEAALDLLVQISEQRQVLYFTCRSHVPEVLRPLLIDGGEVNTVWLAA